MPANLTPQYLKAEEQFRKAQSAQERLDALEEMLVLIPKHKGTEKLQAELKSKLKEAREESADEKKAPKKTKSFKIPRQGAGQVVLIGGPNAGKSRILKELTHAHPEVAPYPFTTREPMPGMMAWQDVHVQLIDTPPITAEHLEGYVASYVRSADVVALCFDGSSDDAPEQTEAVVKQLADRKTRLDATTGFDEDDLSLLRVKTLLVVTHADAEGYEDRVQFFREMLPTPWPTVLVELDRPESVAALRDAFYAGLDVIRVYTKAPGKPADMTAPFTLPRGGLVEDLAGKVHRDLAAKLKFAKVWGPSAKSEGQTVGPEHVLADKDVVELHAG